MSIIKEYLPEMVRLALAVLGALVTAYIIPWLRQRIGETRYKRLLLLAETAVLAVEQMYPEWSGAEKLNEVLGYLSGYGYGDGIETRSAVESAVVAMNAEMYKKTPGSALLGGSEKDGGVG